MMQITATCSEISVIFYNTRMWNICKNSNIYIQIVALKVYSMTFYIENELKLKSELFLHNFWIYSRPTFKSLS